MYKNRKLTNREKLDVATMAYFIPRESAGKFRIYPNDWIKMSDFSTQGIVPKRTTKGFEMLKRGQIYRDYQITSYRQGIRDGIITKSEIVEGLPKKFHNWIWRKIKDVPYDIDGEATRMWIKDYRRLYG